MSLRELQVNTLQGSVFTLDVGEIETVQQLKLMLLEKFPGDPIDQKILKVDVLHNGCLLDAQTLSEGGLHPESKVTVIYRRNEVEAATKDDVHTKEFCELNIPDTVMTIPERAFSSCDQVVKVTIPDSVTEIGNNAFNYCTSLESITIPSSVTWIADGAFRGCTSLKSITIPDSVTGIGSYAFASCISLRSITIPNSVTKIRRSAFQSCTSLESVTIPDSVTEIGIHAFAYCHIDPYCISLEKASPFLMFG